MRLGVTALLAVWFPLMSRSFPTSSALFAQLYKWGSPFAMLWLSRLLAMSNRKRSLIQCGYSQGCWGLSACRISIPLILLCFISWSRLFPRASPIRLRSLLPTPRFSATVAVSSTCPTCRLTLAMSPSDPCSPLLRCLRTPSFVKRMPLVSWRRLGLPGSLSRNRRWSTLPLVALLPLPLCVSGVVALPAPLTALLRSAAGSPLPLHRALPSGFDLIPPLPLPL